MSRRFFNGRVILAERSAFAVALVTGCFLIGVCGGNAAGNNIAMNESGELYSYFSGFLALMEKEELTSASIGYAVFTYLKYPVLVLCFGMIGAGVFLIPALSAYQGFVLAFSVTSFLSISGESGILPAIVLFGFRCIIVLPCYFYLAEHSMTSAVEQMLRKRSVQHSAAFDRPYIVRMIFCIFVLVCGGFFEHFWAEDILYFIL